MMESILVGALTGGFTGFMAVKVSLAVLTTRLDYLEQRIDRIALKCDRRNEGKHC